VWQGVAGSSGVCGEGVPPATGLPPPGHAPSHAPLPDAPKSFEMMPRRMRLTLADIFEMARFI